MNNNPARSFTGFLEAGGGSLGSEFLQHPQFHSARTDPGGQPPDCGLFYSIPDHHRPIAGSASRSSRLGSSFLEKRP
jgi:hypothetical protein